MIIAHHLIWTAYGWWLPNDPRGSMSHCIRNDLIAELGALHYGRKRVQPASRDIHAFYEKAKEKLQHPLLGFGPRETQAIGECFAEVIRAAPYTCYACAIMPDHVHVLFRKHRDRAEMMIANLQEATRLRLREGRLRDPDHPVWGGPGWWVFLDHPDEVRRTIRYIQGNPAKQGLAAQDWPFVKEYDNWPLHRGHSLDSPYARRRHGEPF
ncbi:MAG TPA: hypothetical protein VMZ50_13540, partial [Phycisphaerae bacterium]|nr:hypothetical protein [Phycisphaerae bacterium]